MYETVSYTNYKVPDHSVSQGSESDANNIPCAGCCPLLRGVHGNRVCNHCDLYYGDFFVESLHVWSQRDFHREGDTDGRDRDGDIQGWTYDAGHGNTEQRQGDFQQHDAGDRNAFDHCCLQRQFKLCRKHFGGADADGQQDQYDNHGHSVSKPMAIRFFGDFHGHGVARDRDGNSNVQGRHHDAGIEYAEQRNHELYARDAIGRDAFDHGHLQRKHTGQCQHIRGSNRDDNQSIFDNHVIFVCKSIGIRFGIDVHGFDRAFGRDGDSNVHGREHNAGDQHR